MNTMKKGINLKDAQIFKVLDRTERHTITAILKTKTSFYLMDIIPFKSYKEYHIFEIEKHKLDKFFNNNNRLYLYPKENQEIYHIKTENLDFENFEVINVYNPLDVHLSVYEEDFLKN